MTEKTENQNINRYVLFHDMFFISYYAIYVLLCYLCLIMLYIYYYAIYILLCYLYLVMLAKYVPLFEDNEVDFRGKNNSILHGRKENWKTSKQPNIKKICLYKYIYIYI